MLALREQAWKHDEREEAKTYSRAETYPLRRSSGGFTEGDNAPLLALAGEPLETRFRYWRGASGRRYVFSVYDRASCPAYNFAVMMVVAVRPDGDRRMVSIVDTGCFPDMVVATATEKADFEEEIEFHVHLMANSLVERCALIEDLSHARRS